MISATGGDVRFDGRSCGRDGAQQAEAPFSVCFLVLDLSAES
jgi:hypothetical protein